jgi:DNA repair ATPase RecN
MNVSSSHVEEFLKAEEEAHRLVDELTKLKAETESYATARGALSEAMKKVSDSAGKLSELAKRLGDVVETMRSIGTPELLQAQEILTGQVKVLGEDVNRTQQSVSTTLAGAVNEVRSLREKMESSETARLSETRTFQSDVAARLTSVQMETSALRRRVLGGTIVLLAALAALGVLVMLIGRV